jgi:hypothetical protein
MRKIEGAKHSHPKFSGKTTNVGNCFAPRIRPEKGDTMKKSSFDSAQDKADFLHGESFDKLRINSVEP